MTQITPSEPVAPAQAPQIYYVASPPSNTLAVFAFVASLIGFHLVGIIMGHVAMSQIKRTHEGGRGLAIAALVIGYVFIGFWVVLLLVWVVGLIIALLGTALVAGTSTYGY